MATIELPHNPDLTAQDVHRAIKAGLVEREVVLEANGRVVVRRGTAQVTVELLQETGSTRLAMFSGAAGWLNTMLQRSTALFVTFVTRDNLEKEVFAAISQRLK